MQNTRARAHTHTHTHTQILNVSYNQLEQLPPEVVCAIARAETGACVSEAREPVAAPS